MLISLDKKKKLRGLQLGVELSFLGNLLVIAKLIGGKLFMKPFYHIKMIILPLKAKKY